MCLALSRLCRYKKQGRHCVCSCRSYSLVKKASSNLIINANSQAVYIEQQIQRKINNEPRNKDHP